MLQVGRRLPLLLGATLLALGCDASTPFGSDEQPGPLQQKACALVGPGLRAQFGPGVVQDDSPFSGNLQTITPTPTPVNNDTRPQLISTQSGSAVQRKFFFILPSLANGSYPTPQTYVSYTESTSATSSTNPPNVWQSTNGEVTIGTCPGGGQFITVVSNWQPAQGSHASGNPSLGVYGRLP